jgi:uncharacterized protein YdeI (YjbR/CyaY-like superfamily)
MADVPEPNDILDFAAPAGWEEWLEEHHESSTGVWLRLAKKNSGLVTITRLEALDLALCYGWIDSQARSEGDATWLQRFTPRRKRSIWSKINRDKVSALINAGRMMPTGLREIERAKADGRWDAAYDSPRTATVPDDLTASLDGDLKAQEFFESLDSQNRYAVLFRIHQAKRPETRARRIQQFVDMFARGEKPYP